MPPAESIAEQEKVDKVKYYPSQSAKSLLRDFFELNPPTHLDPIHPTTSFSADQMIQFARAVGLEVSLASYGMLEDLLLKARIGGVGPAVGLRHSVGKSPFPSVAGSSWGESVASMTNYSLPTVTEVDVGNVVATDVTLEEPCSSRRADARLTAGHGSVEEPGSDSLKTLQEIKRNEKRKQAKMWKWSREGRQNPLLPAGNDKGCLFFSCRLISCNVFKLSLPGSSPLPCPANKRALACLLEHGSPNETSAAATLPTSTSVTVGNE